jgi:ribulose-bisphosphate carboxylase small chain
VRITQGTFSFLPDLSDEEIRKQVQYCLDQGWPINIEYTDDPHPRNTYWEMWNNPMFDIRDAAAIMHEIAACRHERPRHYIKVNAYNIARGRETVGLSFIVNRPPDEPGFALVRQEVEGRTINYRLRSYATDNPEGSRYNGLAADGSRKER